MLFSSEIYNSRKPNWVKQTRNDACVKFALTFGEGSVQVWQNKFREKREKRELVFLILIYLGVAALVRIGQAPRQKMLCRNGGCPCNVFVALVPGAAGPSVRRPASFHLKFVFSANMAALLYIDSHTYRRLKARMVGRRMRAWVPSFVDASASRKEVLQRPLARRSFSSYFAPALVLFGIDGQDPFWPCVFSMDKRSALCPFVIKCNGTAREGPTKRVD